MKLHFESILKITMSTIMLSAICAGCADKQENAKISSMSEDDMSNLPIVSVEASFVYDTEDIRERVGISDYIFVGKIISYDGVRYENTVTIEDSNGKPVEVGSPYTDYTVQVLENMKGSLITDEPIKIVKEGGVSQAQDSVYVFENDEMPVTGNTYIFLGYAQQDGTILISGPYSNVLIEEYEIMKENSSNSENISDIGDDIEIYQSYLGAVENEVIPVERERYQSIYDVNAD